MAGLGDLLAPRSQMAQRRNHLYCTRTKWRGRRAYAVGNGVVALTALCGGGRIAEMRLTELDLSPLWVAPSPTIEPYDYIEQVHAPIYGTAAEGKLLSAWPATISAWIISAILRKRRSRTDSRNMARRRHRSGARPASPSRGTWQRCRCR